MLVRNLHFEARLLRLLRLGLWKRDRFEECSLHFRYFLFIFSLLNLVLQLRMLVIECVGIRFRYIRDDVVSRFSEERERELAAPDELTRWSLGTVAAEHRVARQVGGE